MNNWHSLNIEEVYKYTGSSEKGLKSSDASQKLERCGLNVLPKDKKESLLNMFFSQFKSAMVLVMILAAIISFVASEIVSVIPESEKFFAALPISSRLLAPPSNFSASFRSSRVFMD